MLSNSQATKSATSHRARAAGLIPRSWATSSSLKWSSRGMVSRIRRRSVGVVIRCLAREAAEDDGELIPPRQARYDRGHTRAPATDASWYRSHFGIDDSADPIAQGRPCPNGIWNALPEHRVHAHASTSEVVRPHKHALAIGDPVGPPVEATASGSRYWATCS